MADISKIRIPGGDEYNFKDAELRDNFNLLNGTVGNLNNVIISSSTPSYSRTGNIWFVLQGEESTVLITSDEDEVIASE